MVDSKRFQQDLDAAHLAGIRMLDSQGRQLTAKELESLHQQLEQADNGAANVEEIVFQLKRQNSAPPWYIAAFQVFAETGTTLPALEGLDVRRHSERQSVLAIRWPLLYLLLLTITALAGLWVFYISCAPQIHDFRYQMNLDQIQRMDLMKWLPVMIVGIGVIIFIAVMTLLLIGTRRLSMWLGGRQFVNYSVSSVVLRIAQSTMRHGLPLEDSISVACDITDASAELQNDIHSVLFGQVDDSTILKMANCQQHTARQILTRMKVGFPLLAVSILGGILALLYCIVVFMPIFSILRDMNSIGVGG